MDTYTDIHNEFQAEKTLIRKGTDIGKSKYNYKRGGLTPDLWIVLRIENLI